MKVLSTVVVLLYTTVFALATQQQPRIVSTEGTAEVKRTPDKATIIIGVETSGKIATDVKTENDKKMRFVLASLKKATVADKDIQTSNFSLTPNYNWENGNKLFLGYTMQNTVVVTVRNLAILDAVLSACVAEGANTVHSVQFGITNPGFLRDSLRIEAAKDSQKKATALVQAVGARLGKPISLSEQSFSPGAPVMYQNYARYDKASDEGADPTVSIGEVLIKVTVQAQYEIE
jgi:uncharacterized protein